jgi:hypothetical protein
MSARMQAAQAIRTCMSGLSSGKLEAEGDGGCLALRLGRADAEPPITLQRAHKRGHAGVVRRGALDRAAVRCDVYPAIRHFALPVRRSQSNPAEGV